MTEREREAVAQLALVVGRMLDAILPQLEYDGADTRAMRETLMAVHREMTQTAQPATLIQYMKSTGPIGDAKP